ncbi:LIM domain-containing protein A-like [Bactrocera dorsalis]|uniref:LIM domain-containing protein A-like n=1 Tax=Bactrocera dorsalis TaxID=27457 RepID=A0ABM3JVM5_BACDO|nr:LIM domain-containing protein A-like [Bactrocera dorsalis]
MRSMCCAWDQLPAVTHCKGPSTSKSSSSSAAAAQHYSEQLERTSGTKRVTAKPPTHAQPLSQQHRTQPQSPSQPHHRYRRHHHHHHHQGQPHSQRQYYYQHNGLQYSYQEYGVGGASGGKATSNCRKRKLLSFFKTGKF